MVRMELSCVVLWRPEASGMILAWGKQQMIVSPDPICRPASLVLLALVHKPRRTERSDTSNHRPPKGGPRRGILPPKLCLNHVQVTRKLLVCLRTFSEESRENGDHVGRNRVGKNSRILSVVQPAHLHEHTRATHALARPHNHS